MARVGDKIAVCQHGARRLAFLDLASMNEELIVERHGRARLNGPNDVVATPDALYFTDPYYALLEKGRPADAQYADDKSELGFAGVYRYDLGTKDLEVLDNSLMRPNGIGIVNGSRPRPATTRGGRVDGVRVGAAPPPCSVATPRPTQARTWSSRTAAKGTRRTAPRAKHGGSSGRSGATATCGEVHK